MSDKFHNEVRRLLLQKVPNKPQPADQQFAIEKYKNLVESFIQDVVTPLSIPESNDNSNITEKQENIDPVKFLELSKKGFTLQQTLKYYNIYTSGMNIIKENEVPFEPFHITDEQVGSILNYFRELEFQKYYNLDPQFIKDCYFILTSWYRKININNVREKVYSRFPPQLWVSELEKIKESMDLTPEFVKEILHKMNIYIGSTS